MDGMVKTFAIHTLGCKVNTYESDAMADSLKAAGFVEIGFDEVADIYIINTCTVTNIADRKSRQMLRRARRLNEDALIVAAGCYVDDAIKNGKLSKLIEDKVIDLAVSNKDKTVIASSVIKKISEKPKDTEYKGKKTEYDIESLEHENPEHESSEQKEHFLTHLDGHTRAFIKVHDGCNMYCSYCIIPYVRGTLRSRTPEDVHKEVSLLAANGTAEVVITGIHLSSMRDKLIDIIAAVESVDGIKRIRLGSLEPMLITEEFVGKLKDFKKLCPHFHLSMQSGNDEILKAMNRHYTIEQYVHGCELLKSNYEHPAVTTDIIVGFPGETDAQFEDSCKAAERVGLYEAHVFKYSRRRGTPADTMPGQLTEAKKAIRSERLIELTNRLSREFREYYIGREIEFLSEELIEIDGMTFETGYTAEYVRCIKASSKLHVNEIICGKASRIVQENTVDEILLLV